MLASEQSERDTLRSVQLKIRDILYIMVRAISVYSAGVPYAARYTAAVKTLGYVSVLEFFSIESYLKAISSDYGSNKEYGITEETLRKCGRKEGSA